MNMNYFVFGTNDKEKAVSFYDELFSGCGLHKLQDQGRMTLWGNQNLCSPWRNRLMKRTHRMEMEPC